jgi:hypothetical protein
MLGMDGIELARALVHLSREASLRSDTSRLPTSQTPSDPSNHSSLSSSASASKLSSAQASREAAVVGSRTCDRIPSVTAPLLPGSSGASSASEVPQPPHSARRVPSASEIAWSLPPRPGTALRLGNVSEGSEMSGQTEDSFRRPVSADPGAVVATSRAAHEHVYSPPHCARTALGGKDLATGGAHPALKLPQPQDAAGLLQEGSKGDVQALKANEERQLSNCGDVSGVAAAAAELTECGRATASLPEGLWISATASDERIWQDNYATLLPGVPPRQERNPGVAFETPDGADRSDAQGDMQSLLSEALLGRSRPPPETRAWHLPTEGAMLILT